MFAPFRRITLGALLALVVLAAAMIFALTSRLSRVARDRELLLRPARPTRRRPSGGASPATSTTGSSKTSPALPSRCTR